MNKTITCITILLLLTGQSYCQQLFSTAGQEQNNVSWSVGELITDGGLVSGIMVYQGLFSSENVTRTALSDVRISTITAYPNPVVDILYVKNDEKGFYTYTITDIVGRVLIRKKVDTDQEINLSRYSAGQYILKVSTSLFSKSTIIIKR